jgi:hypothetical protein
LVDAVAGARGLGYGHLLKELVVALRSRSRHGALRRVTRSTHRCGWRSSETRRAECSGLRR